MPRGTRMNSPRPKILTVQFKSLGDTVVSIPTLVAIRQRFPDCELHAVVPEASVPLLRHHPALNRVWGVPRAPGKAQFRAYWPIIRKLRAEKFDKCVDLGGNDRSAIVMFLSGARERLGALHDQGFWGKRWLFTRPVTALPEDRHESLRLLHTVSPWNISPPEKIQINIHTDPAVANPLQRDPSKRTIICNTGAASPKKQWPIANWARFHQLATARGYDLVYIRGVSPFEEQMTRELETLVPGAKILPKLDLPQLLVAIKSADAAISNDTGPMHFATGLGVKTVAIFGPSLHQRWFPAGTEHRLLLAPNCECIWGTFVCRRANHCLAEITPEAVLENLESLFQ
jgi:ADP-heptose:LPS heptosyltransferase